MMMKHNGDRYLYMILEFCDGGTLSDRVKKVKGFSEKDAVEVLHQVNFALNFLHSGFESPIAHRDIKTDNIFVDDVNQTGHVLYMLGDLGFAKEGNKQMNLQIGTP